MIIAEFEHDINQNRMILYKDEAQKGTEEEFQSEMLIRNEIKGLLPVQYRIFNNQIQYCYDISGLQSLSSIIEHNSMNRKELELLFQALFDCIRSISIYLLEESAFLLEQEYIFIHLPSYQVRFCYFPGRKESLKKQLDSLMEYLMNHIDYKDQKAILFLYSLYMKNKEDTSSLHDLESFLKDTSNEPYFNLEEPNIDNQESEEEQIKPEVKSLRKTSFSFNIIFMTICFLVSIGLGGIAIYSGLCLDTFGNKLDGMKLSGLLIILFVINITVAKVLFHLNLNTKISFHRLNSNEIAIYNPDIEIESIEEEANEDETVVLFDPRQKEQGLTTEPEIKEESILLRLIPQQKELYQTIIIDETPFYIGKLKTRTNSTLSNSAVSRIHSKIVKDQEKILLYDMNSTNGTFINGDRLPVNGYKEIKTGDVVEFANATFHVEKTLI